MRLRAINIFSSYFGNEQETKKRTRVLRADSDFLDYEYLHVVKYCDNDFIKQLNIECNENAEKIFICRNFSDGYPTISIPFNFSLYRGLSAEKKKKFWIKEIEKVFDFVLPFMNCKSDKIADYIKHLNENFQME